MVAPPSIVRVCPLRKSFASSHRKRQARAMSSGAPTPPPGGQAGPSRIARDTGFSPDKSPYKTYIGAYIAPKGKKSGFAGYYFHIEPCCDSLIWSNALSAGLYCPEPVVLRSVRDEITDNGAEIAAAIRKAKGFDLVEENKLKRVPTGFPADSEYADMLKLKDFYIAKRITEEFLLADDLLEKTLAEFRRTQPFVAILNRAVQFAYEEMM